MCRISSQVFPQQVGFSCGTTPGRNHSRDGYGLGLSACPPATSSMTHHRITQEAREFRKRRTTFSALNDIPLPSSSTPPMVYYVQSVQPASRVSPVWEELEELEVLRIQAAEPPPRLDSMKVLVWIASCFFSFFLLANQLSPSAWAG